MNQCLEFGMFSSSTEQGARETLLVCKVVPEGPLKRKDKMRPDDADTGT